MPPPPPYRGTGAAPRACAVLASCLRHACNEGKTTRLPPPPHTPPPPQGWGMKEGRGGQRPPLLRSKRKDGEVAERGCGTDHTTVPEGSTRRASPHGGGTGGANAGWEGRRRGPRGMPLSPAEGQVPRVVPAPCLRLAYAGGRTARAPPPPPKPFTPPPTKEGGEDSEGVARGHGGGTEDRPTCQGKRRAASGEKKKEKKNNHEQSIPTR